MPTTANAHMSKLQLPPQSPASRQQSPPKSIHSASLHSTHILGPQDQRSTVSANTGIPISGFYSAKAADLLDNQNNPQDASTKPPSFNPHAETPSIRKTAGVDHSRSGKIRRDHLAQEYGVATPGPTTTVDNGPTPDTNGTSSRNFINPNAEAGRRVGAPTSATSNMSPATTRSAAARGSPMTSAYRPPTRHGGSNAIQLVSEVWPNNYEQ